MNKPPSQPPRSFVNTAFIDFNSEFVTIDFGVRAKSTEEPVVLHRVMLNPHAAKLLMLGLTQVVAEHEKIFGEIKTASQEQVQLAAQNLKKFCTLTRKDLN